jgi:hypothetical protein
MCGPRPHCLTAWATDVRSLATVTGGGSLNPIRFQIQTDSNQIQIVSNFDRSKNGLPELKKYGCEVFEEGNNFLHHNFFRFEMDFK